MARDRLARERARLLRRVGRIDDARAAWRALAERNGPLAAIAWVELAKVLEHIERDFTGALAAVAAAEAMAARSARLGRPLPKLERDLAWRRRRLERRRAAHAARRDRAPIPGLPEPSATAKVLPHPLAHR